jgi:inosine/xanthosine triphosphatase
MTNVADINTTSKPRLNIAVGSKNRAKLESVRLAVEQLFPQCAVHVHGFTVPSHVSDQPMSDQETMDGALNRAKMALQTAITESSLSEVEFHYGVGLEGGVQKLGERWFESGWICAVDRDGRSGWGSSARFELSQKVMKRLMAGEELAQVMDDLSGRVDVRSGDGAMGLLTNGRLPRAEAYRHGVLFAFAPFVSDKIYWH